MRSTFFPSAESDCSDFMDLVERVVAGRLRGQPSQNVHAIKVDNWFDHKWLKFLGTFGSGFKLALWTKEDLVVPPFAPDRIVSSRRYRYWIDFDEYCWQDSPAIHRPWAVPARVPEVSTMPLAEEESGLFAWVSGNTIKNGRGCLMVYDIMGKQRDSWYCGFVKAASGWRLEKCKGTAPTVVNFYAEHGRVGIR